MNYNILSKKAIFIIIFAISCLNWTKATAQNQYSIYATMMYHFAKYTQFPSSNNQMVIGVMGKTPLNHETLALNGKTVGASQIQVKEINEMSEIGGCNIVFVPSKLAGKYAEVLTMAKEYHTLIISDAPDAYKSGVVINFFEEGTKVRFEISNKNAMACGLKISSDLQKLAKVID